MSWLIALAGFAGIMAVFSTVVTVGVEATHKLLGSRRNGLMEMMRSMHENVLSRMDIAGPDGEAVPQAREGRAFASTMVRSPSSGGRGRKLTPWDWGLNILHHRFERLSKRQFAEQLAQTEYGQRLAQQDRASIQRALGQLAYEFDRHGAAQSDYFRRRAKVYSALIAFAFVAFGNINAIEIYKHLAKNEAAVGRLVPMIEQGAMMQQAQTAVRPEAGTAEIAESYERTMAMLKAESALPVGRGYFPFCEASAAPPEPDPRCGIEVGRRSVMGVEVPGWIVRAVHEDTFGDWAVWLLSIITTAGLLGLGAPFWFDLFSKAASMTTGQIARLKPEAAQAPAALPPGLRGPEETDVPGMTDSLLIAAGYPERAYPGAGAGAGAPGGMRLGAASTEATGPGAQSAGLGLRLPPGAVKG